jgi:transposase
MDSLILPEVNTQTMSLFLEEVSSRHPDDFILMFMDRAGWHRSSSLTPPPNISLQWLPPYSPECNPAEHIGEDIRENWFSNTVFSSLNAVENTLVDSLVALENNSEKVRSLTGFDWIICNPLNAT